MNNEVPAASIQRNMAETSHFLWDNDSPPTYSYVYLTTKTKSDEIMPIRFSYQPFLMRIVVHHGKRGL